MKNSWVFVAALILASCGQTANQETNNDEAPLEEIAVNVEDSSGVIHYAAETHLKNVRQLTFGGDNAEAYWSFDDSKLVLQVTNPAWDIACDQIFLLDMSAKHDSMPLPMLSTGMGRTTCAYFMPGDSTILYASTHLGNEACPPSPERMTNGKYVWPIYSDFDIFIADLNGNIIKQLTDEPGYDAEATVSPKGDKIVFTSLRSGDLELYTMNIDGTDVKQITDGLGYDGGAFFSPDGNKLVFRASRPQSEEDVKTYKDLLATGLVQPTEMEIYTCNVDGSDLKQITNLGKANWAPYYHPSGEKIIFASNHAGERGYEFNLFMIGADGTGLERITHDLVFDAFPMFSNDGKQLVWGSNRHNNGTRETNVFVADWIE